MSLPTLLFAEREDVQGGVGEFATATQGKLHGPSCSGVGLSLYLKVLRTSCSSIYALLCRAIHWRMVSWLTLPAMLRKNERVHNDGNFSRCGNSCRTSSERRPVMSREYPRAP